MLSSRGLYMYKLCTFYDYTASKYVSIDWKLVPYLFTVSILCRFKMHDMIESKQPVVNGHGCDSFEVFPIKLRLFAFNVLLL